MDKWTKMFNKARVVLVVLSATVSAIASAIGALTPAEAAMMGGVVGAVAPVSDLH